MTHSAVKREDLPLPRYKNRLVSKGYLTSMSQNFSNEQLSSGKPVIGKD